MKNGYQKAEPIIKTIDSDLELDKVDSVRFIRRTLQHEQLHKLNYLRMIKNHCEMLIDLSMGIQ